MLILKKERNTTSSKRTSSCIIMSLVEPMGPHLKPTTLMKCWACFSKKNPSLRFQLLFNFVAVVVAIKTKKQVGNIQKQD